MRSSLVRGVHARRHLLPVRVACRAAGGFRAWLASPSGRDVVTVPNALTVARIASVPFICYSIAAGHPVAAFWLFGAAAASDALDGYVARRWNQRSKLGSFLDPVADKLMVMSTSAALALSGMLPPALVVLFLMRDATLLQGAMWHRYRSLPPPKTLRSFFAISPSGMEVQASRLSKLNTLLQVGVISFAIVSGAMEPSTAQQWQQAVLPIVVPLVAATTWFSGLQYYMANPFQHLVSVGVTPRAQRIAQALNLTLLIAGFAMFLASIATRDSVGKAREGASADQVVQ